jgi:copper chaperone
MKDTLTYMVSGMHCAHCEHAITSEVSRVAGVRHVHVDLSAKRVVVSGEGVSDDAVRDAIGEAGYEAI